MLIALSAFLFQSAAAITFEVDDKIPIRNLRYSLTAFKRVNHHGNGLFEDFSVFHYVHAVPEGAFNGEKVYFVDSPDEWMHYNDTDYIRFASTKRWVCSLFGGVYVPSPFNQTTTRRRTRNEFYVGATYSRLNASYSPFTDGREEEYEAITDLTCRFPKKEPEADPKPVPGED